MATTGNLKQIDEALQRPGRMDRVFHLQRPTQAEREKILHIAAKETMDNELIDFVDWRKVIAESVSDTICFHTKAVLRLMSFLCGIVTWRYTNACGWFLLLSVFLLSCDTIYVLNMSI